jgi:hypothetical protein
MEGAGAEAAAEELPEGDDRTASTVSDETMFRRLTASIKPAILTWRCQFADHEMECEFRRTELKPLFPQQMTRLGLLVTVMYALVAGQNFLEGGWPAWTFEILMCQAMVYFLCALAFLLVDRGLIPQPSLQLEQLVLLVLLNFSCVTGPITFLPDRLRTLGFDNAPVPPAATALAEASYSLRIAVSMVASSAFCPLDPQLYAWHIVPMVGVFFGLEIANGIERANQVVELLMLVMSGLVCVFFRAYIRLNMRSDYYFRQAVVREMLATRRAEQAYLKHKLELQAAKRLSQSRSKLIRVVMHDLRRYCSAPARSGCRESCTLHADRRASCTAHARSGRRKSDSLAKDAHLRPSLPYPSPPPALPPTPSIRRVAQPACLGLQRGRLARSHPAGGVD